MLKYITISLFALLSVVLFSPATSAASTAGGGGATGSGACGGRLLTLPPWYRGLTNGDCSIKSPEKTEGGLRNFIIKIILNISEAIMQLVAYASILFLVIGGFRYMFASADPEQVSKGKTTVRNAIIGLLISLFAVAIVNVLFGALS